MNPVKIRCGCCEKTFEVVPPEPQPYLDNSGRAWVLPKTCLACRTRFRVEAATSPPTTCRTCRTLFFIDASERAWRARHGLNLPKRCKPCTAAFKEKDQLLKKGRETCQT